MERQRRARGQGRTDEGEKLGPVALQLSRLGAALAVGALAVGFAGLLVVLDEAGVQDGKPRRFSGVSDTQFGELWRYMTEKNPFWTTVWVNGGGMLLLLFGRKLWEHGKAVKAEARRRRVAGAKKDT